MFKVLYITTVRQIIFQKMTKHMKSCTTLYNPGQCPLIMLLGSRLNKEWYLHCKMQNGPRTRLTPLPVYHCALYLHKAIIINLGLSIYESLKLLASLTEML